MKNYFNPVAFDVEVEGGLHEHEQLCMVANLGLLKSVRQVELPHSAHGVNHPRVAEPLETVVLLQNVVHHVQQGRAYREAQRVLLALPEKGLHSYLDTEA